MKIKVTVTKEIDRCYNQCPYFGLDGVPGAVMICNHPNIKTIEESYIISHPSCDEGFPEKCPLIVI